MERPGEGVEATTGVIAGVMGFAGWTGVTVGIAAAGGIGVEPPAPGGRKMVGRTMRPVEVDETTDGVDATGDAVTPTALTGTGVEPLGRGTGIRLPVAAIEGAGMVALTGARGVRGAKGVKPVVPRLARGDSPNRGDVTGSRLPELSGTTTLLYLRLNTASG